MKKSIAYYLTHPQIAMSALMAILSDRYAIEQQWKRCMDYSLDLENPKTYNEKLQWLKLHDHNPLYTTLVDKYKVKRWVADIIGEEYVIPTLTMWHSADDIDISSLPKRFVLKCNHDSGSVIVCKDKARFDLNAAKELFKKALKKNFYYHSREWPYKNVKPCVFAEAYMEDETTHDLPDYKFFCFNGEAKSLFIASERMNNNTETRFDFFDRQFNHIDVTNGHPNADKLPEKPVSYEQMLEIADKLSEGIPHVRVDLYEINGKVYFGEMTFYHWGGLVPFKPQKWDYIFGDMLKLPNV